LHKEHPAGKDTKLVRIFLNRLQQQNPERYKEATDHQDHAECPPRLRIPRQEKLRLLRDVCIPDEHVLTKTDVGPENAEREHPFPHDVIVLVRDDALQVTGLSQSGDHNHEQCHRATRCSGKDVDAEHG
jgi:hypothetical protein